MVEEKSSYLYKDAYEAGRILSDPNALEKNYYRLHLLCLLF